jgi:hypothetical protein
MPRRSQADRRMIATKEGLKEMAGRYEYLDDAAELGEPG